MFEDRKDAGRRLARALDKYRDSRPLILAIPRGGVEVGYQVAKHLKADFSLLVSRKLPLPNNPEAGFGAISENGSTYLVPGATSWLSTGDILRIKEAQSQEVKRRIKALRQGKSLPEISGRTVILVDDGLAMGSTMKAALMFCRNKKAAKIVVAVPVSGRDTASHMSKIADDLVVLETPPYFRAVAQVYENWHDVTDEEVIRIMSKWRKRASKQE
jgi:predicted phosphoribosyltransferase